MTALWLKKVLWLAAAGALGTLARYGLSSFVQRHATTIFPWGTLTVNMLGCFLFGLIWSLAEHHSFISSEGRMIALIGFMGAFTTFSSFAFETSELIRDAEWTLAIANIAIQNIVGIAFLALGVALGRYTI